MLLVAVAAPDLNNKSNNKDVSKSKEVSNHIFHKEPTVFTDKKAKVTTSRVDVFQEPHTLKPGEKGVINLKNKGDGTSWEVCFDFKGQEDNVRIDSVGEPIFFGLFTTRLGINSTDEGYYCTDYVRLNDEKEIVLDFTYEGKGKLKYDVILRNSQETIILDPYLIGTIPEDPNVVFYFPLNGSLDNFADYNIGTLVNTTNLAPTYVWDNGYNFIDSNLSSRASYSPGAISTIVNATIGWTDTNPRFISEINIDVWFKNNVITTGQVIDLYYYNNTEWVRNVTLNSSSTGMGNITFNDTYMLNKSVYGLLLAFQGNYTTNFQGAVQAYSITGGSAVLNTTSPQYTVNPLSESTTALLLNGSSVSANSSTINDTLIQALSLWYQNTSGTWKNVINNSNDWYIDGVLGSQPADYPVAYLNNQYVFGINQSSDYQTINITEVLGFDSTLNTSLIASLASGFDNQTKIGICNSSATLVYPFVEFYYYNQVTGDQINASHSFFVDLIGSDTSNASGTFNNATSNVLCMNRPPSSDIYLGNLSGTYTISYPGLLTKINTISPVDGVSVNNENITNVSFYLADAGNTSTISFNWITTQYTFVEGIMRIYECNNGGTKTMIESLPIVSGQASANLELFFKLYAYDIISNGQVFRDDSFYTCHVEATTERNFYVDIFPQDLQPTVGLYLVDCSISKVAPDTVTMSWGSNQQSADPIVGCIEAYQQTIYNRTKIYENCTTGSETSITRLVPNNGQTYDVQGYLIQNGNEGQCRNGVTFYTEQTAGGAFGTAAIFGVFLLIVGLVLLFGGSGVLQLGAAGFAIVGAFILGVLSLPWTWVASVIALLIIVAIVGRVVRK